MNPTDQPDPMPDEPIRASWERYRKHVVHEDAGPDQLRQLRQAFFAGSCFVILYTDKIAGNDLTVEQGSHMYGLIHTEYQKFLVEMALAAALADICDRDGDEDGPAASRPETGRHEDSDRHA